MEKAVLAHESPGLIGHSSELELNYSVISNLDDCTITIPDVDNTRKSFGPILGGVRGKTTQQNTEHVTTDYVVIPKDFCH